MSGVLDQAQATWANYLWSLWRSGRWSSQPDDERTYGQNHLAQHLDEAHARSDRVFALLDESWLQSWLAVENGHDGFLRDVERIWRRADDAQDLAIQVKCALCASSVAAVGANISAGLLGLWLDNGLLKPGQAIELARRAPGARRAELLVAIIPALPLHSLDEALEAVGTIDQNYHEINRNDALAALAPRLPATLHARALELARSIDAAKPRSRALAALAPHLCQDLVGEALSAARAIESPEHRMTALLGIAAGAHPDLAAELVHEALRTAESVGHDEERAKALTKVAACATGDLRDQALQAALTTARTIVSTQWNALADPERRATAVIRLIALLSEPARAPVIDETLDLVGGIENGFARAQVLRTLMAHLPDVSLPRALDIACSVDDWALEAALEAVMPRLRPSQIAAALERARAVAAVEARAEALAVVASGAPPGMREALSVEAIDAASQIPLAARVYLLVKLIPLGGGAVAARLADELRRLRSPGDRAWCLAELAALSPDDDARRRLANEAFESARRERDLQDRWRSFARLLAVASGPTLARIVSAVRRIVPRLGASRFGSSSVEELSERILALPGDHWEFAASIVRTIPDRRERADALGRLASRSSPLRKAALLAEALASAREMDDSSERLTLLAELVPHVDTDLAASEAQLMARAGPYAAGSGEDWDDDEEDEEDDDAADVTRPRRRLSEAAASTALSKARAIGDELERSEAISSLAARLPAEAFGKYLDAVGAIGREDARRECLEAAYPYLPDSRWPDVFDIVRSISDPDGRGEGWIVLVGRAPESLRRTAQEEGLATLATADNEDDYPEPFLRFAYDLPDDLLARAIPLVAALEGSDDPDRRANIFCGLGQEFRMLHCRNPGLAMAAWTESLHRLAFRPRDVLLTDLVGFQNFGRVLAGEGSEAHFARQVHEAVREVCSWQWRSQPSLAVR